jgi:putative SOS response-associated peptidase YedK
MCGRASLTKTQKELEQRLQAEFYREDLEQFVAIRKYNIAPTHLHPVVTNKDPKHIQLFKWGLIPFWAKDEKIGSKMINARMETILEKPAFRSAIQKRRCLVPFDGFYEWKKTPNGKTPFRITLKDEGIFCAAGIWESWKDANNREVFSFSVITLPPNQLMSSIHDRMPAILLPEQEEQWLDLSLTGASVLENIAPYPDQAMRAYTVSTRVNKVSTNEPSLLDEVLNDSPTQGSLF